MTLIEEMKLMTGTDWLLLIAMCIVLSPFIGIPVFYFYWESIGKEAKEAKENDNRKTKNGNNK